MNSIYKSAQDSAGRALHKAPARAAARPSARVLPPAKPGGPPRLRPGTAALQGPGQDEARALLRTLREDPFHAPMLESYQRAGQRLAGARVLDYGCGYGWGAWLLAGPCKQVTGYDPDRGRVEAGRALFSAPNLRLLGRRPRPGSGRFDAVCCFQVLQCLPDPAAALEALAAELLPGMELHLSTRTGCVQAAAALDGLEQSLTVRRLYRAEYPMPHGQRLVEAGFLRRAGPEG